MPSEQIKNKWSRSLADSLKRAPWFGSCSAPTAAFSCKVRRQSTPKHSLQPSWKTTKNQLFGTIAEHMAALAPASGQLPKQPVPTPSPLSERAHGCAKGPPDFIPIDGDSAVRGPCSNLIPNSSFSRSVFLGNLAVAATPKSPWPGWGLVLNERCNNVLAVLLSTG